ncbi:equilibrative nucleoside transporter 2 [Gambusia affinis]|uniref:equilibrative nucleoside transporter 2 n=1 Tax=Gambusia affinis TaxID=33528 RepID=UPI001CDD3EF6|nr:equilibrative nucleoside transporter 2 [Gambusia affinis]XP_043953949.1 equilibrative nucleoside transporter 2 [Gambusia affinis]XP_043953951.1 equilibrative nucleoside transporter 2 [Gambusia affinis]XP_043953952.1 equilibrative nucleoside transporter 2 [Gambusia affinis]XP_043953953.1 equilibrative nucleoside transporter 2 [Gambusia affinis]XP_043953954.1 equilibrative nucleoside transporter 2 [Gambusia affinis]
MKVRPDTPKDRCCLVGIFFFILGLGTLLPWNFFMTASLYFQSRLNNTELMNGTSVRKEYHFNNWMTFLSQLPLLVFTLLNSFMYHRISEAIRIAGSLVFILLFFILTAVLVKVDMDEDLFFSVTMAIIWFINSFGAVLQGSLFGLVGLLPQNYSAVFMSGQGLAGTFAAIANLLATASDADSESAALGYFITPCVGTLVTLLSYLLLPRMEFARFYLNRSSKYEKSATDKLLTDGASLENEKLNGHANGAVATVALNSSSRVEAKLETSPDRSEQADSSADKASVMEVFKKIWVMAFCVTFTFTVTLSVFPAITVDVKTAFPHGKWQRYFIAVCCFLVFNISDWFGRSVTTWIRWPGKESRVFPVLVVSRVIFIPLLMFCNVERRTYLPVLFSHDAAFTLIMALFSLSSGYFVCLSMSYAPQLVEPKNAETAGALMTFFLALGLSVGAALSFLFRSLV